MLSEHFLVLAIIYSLADTLMHVPETLSGVEQAKLKSDAEYLLGIELGESENFYESVRKWAQREIVTTQRTINDWSSNTFYDNCYSFAAGIMPLLGCLRNIPGLRDSHFLLMIDDAHDLNHHQSRSLNSWIAYRDHSQFSFKVASAKVGQPTFITTTGGSILEGHDFTTVDMEQPIQTATSDFGRMAAMIIQKRLARVGINKEAGEYFPVSPQFEGEMRTCRETVKNRLKDQHPEWTPSRVDDYLYKFGRAEYFRTRHSKAESACVLRLRHARLPIHGRDPEPSGAMLPDVRCGPVQAFR